MPQKRSTKSKRRSTIGLGFTGDPYEVRKIVVFAEQAERSGYDYFFMCEDFFLRDAISTLACVAYQTKRIKLGTGVISPYTRNPILTALTMSTLDELAKGRMILTLGTGVQPLLEGMGVKFEHPLNTMKEAVEVIKEFQTGRTVNYPGSAFNIKGVKFGANPYYGMDAFTPSKYPIFVAAMGPKMLALAGAISDGTLFTAGFAVQHSKDAVSLFTKGAESVGKDASRLDVACYILGCLGKPSRPIRKFVTWEVAYATPGFLSAIEVSEKAATELRNVLEKKGEAAAMAILPDKTVGLLSACGTKGEIQSRFEEYRKVGVNIPVLVPLGTDTKALIASVS